MKAFASQKEVVYYRYYKWSSHRAKNSQKLFAEKIKELNAELLKLK